ncbi:Ni/Fe-hydrogenase cytochrome b subunit [Sideroxydans sp. CL21]|uniref:Ni/Fe-hydrogenase cytochrome b subunit n=1 Tax=Sideroxydans sp. CL21 TaxID=2600596 RepID=UPI0012A7DE2F|nr:Ni/Fe-hydrogenase cytochrome b subunit [Sideroxydans sp. CL21]VVC83196.1 Ni/Fe-hydrogenase 2 b-type cytochrome subunit HybB [Sideroxydans sp. CL21]
MSASHKHPAPAPLGGSFVTTTTKILAALVAIAAVILAFRFIFGLGAVTNINDGYPWGIWVVYDVVIGSAFACGGYSVALLVYIFNKGEYHPMVRPALLASLFGYTLAGAGVMLDLGRYWNFWHIFWPGYAQVNSVMFEVAVCITAYIVVMWIEFSPAFLEKFGMKNVKRKLNKFLFLIIALGVLLPSMHQSSLGSLLVVFGYQIHPLWQTMLLPLLFLMTALAIGFAVVIFEACLSSSGFKRPLEMQLLGKLSKVMLWMLTAYLIVRFVDLIVRGAVGSMFELRIEALMFWIENALFIAPLVILANPKSRRNPSKLFIAAVCLMLAGFLLRINSFLVGYETGPGWHYFPSVPEIMVSIGMIALEILGYIALVRYLPILPGTTESAIAGNK